MSSIPSISQSTFSRSCGYRIIDVAAVSCRGTSSCPPALVSCYRKPLRTFPPPRYEEQHCLLCFHRRTPETRIHPFSHFQHMAQHFGVHIEDFIGKATMLSTPGQELRLPNVYERGLLRAQPCPLPIIIGFVCHSVGTQCHCHSCDMRVHRSWLCTETTRHQRFLRFRIS